MTDDELRLVIAKLATISVIGARASLIAAYPVASKESIEELDKQLEHHTDVLCRVLDGSYGGE